MNLSRRRFVILGALSAAAAGCDSHGDPRKGLFRWMGKPIASELGADLTPPQSTEIDAVSHLLNRLTYGPRPGDYARVSSIGAEQYMEEQLAPEKIDDWECDHVVRHEFPELGEPDTHFFPRRGDDNDPLQHLFPALKNRGARVGDLYEYKDHVLLDDLTRATILRAVLSRRQLFEVMAGFWSDHFNIDPSKGECKWLKAGDDRDVVRAHALGNMRDLVRASALSPAMLWYLDGRVNARKSDADKPNENYARELMELHTLGVHGGYSQKDVMEVARCLTGWTVRDRNRMQKGKVEFDATSHDDGAKEVLGTPIPAGLGAGDLDRVLEIVVRHPSTARHIAAKLCRHFIADDPPERAVAAVAEAFSSNGGEIRPTLRALFGTDDFKESRGTKLKRPFQYVISALRVTNADTDGAQPIVNALVRMGHAPFRYATPDGYPEGASHWTNTLLWRWSFAAGLAENKLPRTQIDAAGLLARVGGGAAFMATCFGRQPSREELAAFQESGSGIALALGAPAFQRC